MKIKIKYCFLIVLLSTSIGLANAVVKIDNMRCEFSNHPIGVDTSSPRFTWMYIGDEPFFQEYYQLLISTSISQLKSGVANVFDSGKIRSDQSFAQARIPQLKGKTTYYWRIKVWKNNGRDAMVSTIAAFETGILPGMWTARWITDQHDKDFKPAPLFRKEFNAAPDIENARLYISAAGYYKIMINGKKVGHQFLDPAYTDFSKRILFNSFDVTDQIRSGENCIATVLGNGWYNIQSLAVWNFDLAEWRNRPRFVAELDIHYRDGSRQTVITDSGWKTSTGPCLFDNLYSGDIYDARLEKSGWDKSGFNDQEWVNAMEVPSPAPVIQSQLMPPIRVTEQIVPQKITSFGDSLFVVDFGKNFSGFCRLSLKAPRGTKITLRYGEKLDANGQVDQSPINKYFHKAGPLMKRPAGELPVIDSTEVFQMDTYIFKGSQQPEVFTPEFTYHGFRYVEVKSSNLIHLKKNNISGSFLHTDVHKVGNFECSNPNLNKLYQATMRSYLSNLQSIPTDCPQREKNGWTADAYMSIDLALLNYDGILLYEKWMRDFIDNQNPQGRISGIIPSAGWGYIDWIGPTWDVAMFAIPDALYTYYGQTLSIEQLYPVMEKYLNYLQSREVNGAITFGIGDWVPVKTVTPTDFTSMCSYYYMNRLMTKFSKLLHKPADSYEHKTVELKKRINDTYFNPATLSYANGSQTSFAYPLYIGLVPDQFRKPMAAKLNQLIIANNYQIDFGMLGSKYVPRVLAGYGYRETVEKMLLNTQGPSWLGWIKDGLTTLPEWFQKKEYENASLNHVFLGDISAWMVQNYAGIAQEKGSNGFNHLLIKPFYSKRLQWAKGSYLTPNGHLSSFWSRKNGHIMLVVTIPQNCTATVFADKEYHAGPGIHTFQWIEKQK